ncbi:hypothetical protein R1sor_018101 [Riccia sorocarpa]|uniref:Uncharacterized protein n=1 Tax=Riccia sorocarpa TaxID=122646 RepID=A0ABD3IC10_9MARC
MKINTCVGTIGVASIYGPHDAGEKRAFMEYLVQMAEPTQKWIWMGDWNFIGDRRDSAGPSPVLQSELLLKWRDVELQWVLADMYDRAVTKGGPRFTRQVWRGERLDQARLDRVLKTKQNREHISYIVQEDGSRECNEDNILQMIEDFYADLSSKQQTTPAEEQEIRETLTLIDKQVSEGENNMLLMPPTLEELEKTVESMAHNKSPREDGAPVEVLLALWPGIKEKCVSFFENFGVHRD